MAGRRLVCDRHVPDRRNRGLQHRARPDLRRLRQPRRHQHVSPRRLAARSHLAGWRCHQMRHSRGDRSDLGRQTSCRGVRCCGNPRPHIPGRQIVQRRQGRGLLRRVRHRHISLGGIGRTSCLARLLETVAKVFAGRRHCCADIAHRRGLAGKRRLGSRHLCRLGNHHPPQTHPQHHPPRSPRRSAVVMNRWEAWQAAAASGLAR